MAIKKEAAQHVITPNVEFIGYSLFVFILFSYLLGKGTTNPERLSESVCYVNVA